MKTAILILVCSIVANAQPTASDVYKVLQPSNDVPRDCEIRANDILAGLHHEYCLEQRVA